MNGSSADDVRKWRAIYRLLDKVQTEVFDCGTLCGSACCMAGSTGHDESREMGIYLFPGEELLLNEPDYDSSWMEVEIISPKENSFPPSWTGPVYFLKCLNPPRCPRRWRPLQCRTFPLKPVIDENGVLEMIWNDDDLPYKCPLIEGSWPVHDDFYRATYTVWKHLAADERIFDLLSQW